MSPLDEQANPIKEEATSEAVSSSVKLWTKRIRAARERFSEDFKRMRNNMDFLAGFQWVGQDKMDYDKYIANLTIGMINEKVSSLYARNPRVAAQRRRRLDFQIWDGKMESLEQAAAMMSNPLSPPEAQIQAAALMSDFTNGRRQRDLVDRVSQTLETLLTYEMDNQMPSFKEQMKQLVLRTVVTGVGYVRLDFSRDFNDPLSVTDIETTVVDQIKQAQYILGQLEKGELSLDSPELVTLQSLLSGLGAQRQAEAANISERLIFDFPFATSIIPDPECRSLRSFAGARWVAQEFIMDVDEVNAYFETKVSPSGDVKTYSATGDEDLRTDLGGTEKKTRVCVWEVFHLPTKSHFFLCDGHSEFLQRPTPLEPETNRFWPIFALTFNAVEIEPGKQKATVFPPSDVQLIKSAQKEWNRSRNSLRGQRAANEPKYMAPKGALTENDKEALKNADSNAVIELEGLPPGTDVGNVLQPFKHSPIDPAAYDTLPLNQDLRSALGNQENVLPASAKGTATAATINEQSRVSVTSSNIDDLDELLSGLARSAGEILLKEFSTETVKRICGPGSVWPETERDDYLNLVLLTVQAASSGRPNKALELANFQQIAPTLLAAGAKPSFIVRESIKRLDDRLDVDEALPIGGPPLAGPPPGPQSIQRSRAGPTRRNQLPAATLPVG